MKTYTCEVARASVLEYALQGLEHQISRMEQERDSIRRELSGNPVTMTITSEPEVAHKPIRIRNSRGGRVHSRETASYDASGVAVGRTLTAGARKKIAAAQKKRWAEFRKQKSAKEAAQHVEG